VFANDLSQIRDNIALGDPARAHDDAAIEEAMRHGGASELIARLPDGLDTYLERPVRDCYAGLPDGASVFGGKVDNGVLQGIMGTPADNALSGGEMQRIAVARTFMRSASEEYKVGLLLFDEPSASLDPVAEQGMMFPVMSVRSGMLMAARPPLCQICSRAFGSCGEARQ
jgi:ABC-type transport system involved in cytochrome bd biosynthesis fused ATPase/permease subunit